MKKPTTFQVCNMLYANNMLKLTLDYFHTLAIVNPVVRYQAQLNVTQIQKTVIDKSVINVFLRLFLITIQTLHSKQTNNRQASATKIG